MGAKTVLMMMANLVMRMIDTGTRMTTLSSWKTMEPTLSLTSSK